MEIDHSLDLLESFVNNIQGRVGNIIDSKFAVFAALNKIELRGIMS